MNALQLEYVQDFHNWIEHHITFLRTGQLHDLDTEHLIEELEGMAERDRNELVSHLVILIAHLLKWQFEFKRFAEIWQHAGEYAAKSWRYTIIEQRFQVQNQLDKIPSLKRKVFDAILEAYPKSVKLAAKETGLALTVFPKECPYSVTQLLDDDFYPDLN